jgi:hypothetical protein
MATSDSMPPGRDQAERLVQSYARRQNIYDAALDANGDAAFGAFGFRHDPDKDALVGRAFVAKAWLPEDPPEDQDAYRKVLRALNDPYVGGMFEQGGGYFHLDEDKRMYFLQKDFPLARTTPEELGEGMDLLQDLAATWTMRWFLRVANVAHGRAAPPARPVTRDDPEGTY